MSLPAQSTASRLCSACGICCNGVMFHNVRLQPNDSPQELKSLGLKLKRKRGETLTIQPCPAYQCSKCAIYSQRPGRCQLFECRQLKQVALGEISETEALNTIKETVLRVEQINELLHQAGKTDPKKPLTKRYEKATAEPVGSFSDPKTIELRGRLTRAMRELEAILEKDFRPMGHH